MQGCRTYWSAFVMISLPLPSLDLTVTSLESLLNILGLVHFKNAELSNSDKN